jgi:aryl-alcohol dehydrogenase-like predicted oxidoreductase
MNREQVLERLVLGTAGLAGIWGRVDKKESVKAIHMALDMGITHFDTAPAYADAELILSQALLSSKAKDSFVSTKVGKGKADDPDALVLDYSRSGIRKSVEQSLKLFRRDQLDLVFLHDPVFIKDDEIQPAIDELSMLKEEGKIKELGIGGNYPASFAPFACIGVFSHFMGFNRFNILVQDAKEYEFKQLTDAGIERWQASPLYMGLLGSKYEQYFNERPEWIPETVLQKALHLKRWCEARQLNMSNLAHQYVINAQLINKMVIGASAPGELVQTVNGLLDENNIDAMHEYFSLTHHV